MKFKILLISALAASLASFATAENGSKEKKFDKGDVFQKIDTDGDGRLSKAELDAAAEKRRAERFEDADADGDGFVSKEEMRNHRAKMRELHKEKMKEKQQAKQQAREMNGKTKENKGKGAKGKPEAASEDAETDKE